MIGYFAALYATRSISFCSTLQIQHRYSLLCLLFYASHYLPNACLCSIVNQLGVWTMPTEVSLSLSTEPAETVDHSYVGDIRVVAVWLFSGQTMMCTGQRDILRVEERVQETENWEPSG